MPTSLPTWEQLTDQPTNQTSLPSWDQLTEKPVNPEDRAKALQLATTVPANITGRLGNIIQAAAPASEMGRAQLEQERIPSVTLSPYQQLQMQRQLSGLGATTGPAHPEEVAPLMRATNPAALLQDAGVFQTASDLAADLLNRTGLDPSAQPGVPIIPKEKFEGVTAIPGTNIRPLSFLSPDIEQGVRSGVSEALSGFTEPGQAAMLPFAGLKPVQAAFGVQALNQIPEDIQNIAQSQDLQSGASATTKALINAAMGVGIGKHLLGEEPYAISKRSAETVPVAETPRDSQAVEQGIRDTEKPADAQKEEVQAKEEVKPAAPEEALFSDFNKRLDAQLDASGESRNSWTEEMRKTAFAALKEMGKQERELEDVTEQVEGQEALQQMGLAKPTPPMPESAKARLRARLKRNVEEGVLGPTESPVPPTPPTETVSPAVSIPTSEAPVSPQDLTPALMVDGKPITGGETHAEIMKNALETEDPVAVAKAFADDSTHVFVDKNGKVYTRQEAAEALGEDKALKSERLAELKKAQPVTPGASTGADIPEGTGLKNAIGEVERASYGLPEATPTQKQSMAASWMIAGDELTRNPQAGHELVSQLKSDPGRGLTDVESAILLRHKVSIENEMNNAAERTITATSDAERVAARDTYARLSDQLLELLDMAKERGSQWGREGRWRQAIAKEDFSLSTMERRTRESVGGRRLTDEEHQRLVDLNKQLEARVKELEEAQKKSSTKGSEEEASKAHKEVEESAPKAKTGGTPDEELVNLRDKLAAKLDKNEKATITPLVKKIAEQLWLSGIKELNPMIDALHGILGDLIPGITRLETMDALSGRGQFSIPSQEAVKVAIRDLSAQSRLAAHIEDVQARRPLPRTGPQRDKPTAEQRRLTQQLNELMRKFGVRVVDQATQLAGALNSAKTYTRNRIADLTAEIAKRERIVKEKTPLTPDPELTSLRAQLADVKAQHESIFGKRELTDEQKIARAGAMLDRQIEQLEKDIEFIGPKGPKPSPIETPELLEKRAYLKALQEYRQDLKDAANPKLTPEERALKMVKTRIAKAQADLQAKIAAGDFTRKVRKPSPVDNEVLRARANLEATKQKFEEGLQRNRLADRSTRERIRDFASRWSREFVLSGPITLFKLTGAALEGMTVDPIKEAVGVGVAKVAPRFAEKLELERPSSVAIEAKAWTNAFKNIMSDAANIAKTGKTDLESVYGGRKAIPPEMVAYMGRLHQMLKAPLKRQAWTRSAEILARDYMNKGIDIHDPLIQMQIGAKALRQADRALFMEDNIVVDAYKRLLSRFEQVKPGEKPTIPQIVGSAALRVGLPVVKIPTNLVSRTFQAGFGSFLGSARLATAYAKGIENLKPEQADAIMRQLKAGSIGGAVILFGFLAPELFGGYYEPGKKRKPGELKPGATKIGGVEVPSYLQHRPEFQIAQFGATVRRVMNERVDSKSFEEKGFGEGLMAATMGLIEETPFVNEMFRIKSLQERPGKALGAEVANRLVPQALSQTARFIDTSPTRKPKTFGQQLESGIPGLRETLPTK